MQPLQTHGEYYRNRAAQEREAADRAIDAGVRRIHVEMAEHYESFLAPDDAGPRPTPEDRPAG